MNRRPAVVLLARRTARVGATLLLLLGACRKHEEPVRLPPGMVDGEGRPIVVAPLKPREPVEQATPEAPTVYDFEHGRMDPGALSAKSQPGGPGAARAPNAAGSATEPVERDLNAELSAKLEPAASCVDAALAASQPDGRLQISVSAYVLATGHVSRATVTAPGQPPSALSCIEKQVLALTLAAPIPDAPTKVSGETQVQIKLVAGPDAGPPPKAPGWIEPVAKNPNVAKAVPGDVAKPEPGDVAGPP